MSPAILTRLVQAAAVLAHVPGIRGVIHASDGTACGVVADASIGGHGCDVEEFRLAVAEALNARSLRPVQALLGIGNSVPAEVVLEGNDSVGSFDGGSRWRRSCACSTTEYLLAGPDTEQSLTVAEEVLSYVLADPRRHLWSRPDPELGVTVVACDWPDDITDVHRAVLEQALRDLSVMWRVRSNLELAEG